MPGEPQIRRPRTPGTQRPRPSRFRGRTTSIQIRRSQWRPLPPAAWRPNPHAPPAQAERQLRRRCRRHPSGQRRSPPRPRRRRPANQPRRLNEWLLRPMRLPPGSRTRRRPAGATVPPPKRNRPAASPRGAPRRTLEKPRMWRRTLQVQRRPMAFPRLVWLWRPKSRVQAWRHNGRSPRSKPCRRRRPRRPATRNPPKCSPATAGIHR